MNIPDQFIKLGIQKIVVTSLTRRETMLYREKTGLDIKLQTKLIITIRGFQHLLDSGHITGIGRGGRYDNNPLTYGDFHNLKTVFKNQIFFLLIGVVFRI